jgi:DNA-binding SARP family transcriptional activator
MLDTRRAASAESCLWPCARPVGPHRRWGVDQVDEYGAAELQVRLLGPARIFWREREAILPNRHARGLVALLAFRSRSWTREALAVELWPDADNRSGKWLRQALWLLRSALSALGANADQVVVADEHVIGLGANIKVDVDAKRFQQLLRERPPHPEEALALYQGDLAEDLYLEGLAWHRELLADMYEDALASVASSRLAAGDRAGARNAAERLLERDRLREEAHSVLIEMHGLFGSRSQVVRQYRHLRAILANELNVEPLPETEMAYLTALRRTLARQHRPMGGERLDDDVVEAQLPMKQGVSSASVVRPGGPMSLLRPEAFRRGLRRCHGNESARAAR